MSDESDFDDDIDKLLDEIDTAGPKKAKQPTTIPTSAVGTEAKSADLNASVEPKITLKSDGNGLAVNYGGGSTSGFKLSDIGRTSLGVPQAAASQQFGKSVRFPEEPANPSASTSQASGPKSNFLSNLLGNKEDQQNAAALQTSSEPRIPSSGPATTTFTAAAAKSALQSSKSDWLGLGPASGEDSLSPVPTPGLGRKPLGDRTMARNQDNDEMLRSMGFDPKDAALQRSGAAGSSVGGPRPSLKPPKSSGGFDLDDDFWPSASRPSTAQQQQPPQGPTGEASFRNTLVQKSSLGRTDLFGSSTGIEGPKQQQQGSKSIVDVLPFLGKPKDDTPDASLEPAAPQFQNQPPTSQPPRTVKVVKRVAARSASPGNLLDRPTLQLPTHLVDEDELKSVCNSLKSLYTTQLDMQEKSYQDQMDCLVQSHQRKEQMLREEIRTMQKEYEGRIERLKSELSDTEIKMPQRFHSEMEAIQKMHQQLQRTSSLTEESTSARSSAKSHVELQNLLETHLDRVASEIVGVISKTQLETTAVRHQESRALEARMESMQKKLEAFARLKLDEETVKNTSLIDTERKIKDELSKMAKSQKKLRQDVVKCTVSAIGQTMQALNREETHKKEKMSSQLKEFRKDVRRVLYDLEAKSDSSQRSFTSIDAGHKELLKVLQNLEAQLKSVQTSSTASAFPQDRSNNETQFETRLLREERNSVSESIAQMNVERRKLNEEKVSVQQERIELDRERNKLRDYEVQLRVKIAEAEDMKKQAEEVRRTETAKTLEAAAKLSQVEHERSAQRRQVQDIEQQLRLREGKLIQDKTELMREKEFLEKLRDQLMCPGCLKSIRSINREGSGFLKRSDGDGVEGSLCSPAGGAEVVDNLKFLQMPNYISEENPGISSRAFKDGLYLDDLYYKQFFK